MRHLRADIDRARLPLDRIQIFGEALPLPVDPFGKRRARNVLDAFHQFDQELALVGPYRRKADAAIAHHRRGHAMPARRCEQRVPARLAVVMRVDVDPAWRHEHAFRVDLAMRFAARLADFHDTVAFDGDVALERLGARAVDDGTSADDQIVHGLLLGAYP